MSKTGTPVDESHDARLRTIGRVTFGAFALVALFFLVTEHRAHLYGALPFLFVLACPLMHLFHHHGHGAHRHEGGSTGDTSRTDAGASQGDLQ